MKTWRLLKLDVNDAFTNMAVDEAITTARIQDRVPNTLRLYRWEPSAVSVGRFQDVFKEVQVENCRRHDVDVVRRITGGGTVYHDSQGEITYSVVVKEKDLGTTDVAYAYNKICNGLINAVKILGVNADFSLGDLRNCPNLVINGRKISGSSQYHKGGVLLQHGTLLIDVDLEEMFTYLRVPSAETVSKIVCVAKERITSVKEELQREVDVQEAYDALVQGFQQALNMKLKEEPLTEKERKLTSRLRNERYSTSGWNIGNCKDRAAD